MGKRKKNSSAEVDAAHAAVPPVKSAKGGKRRTAEPVEDPVSAKKQKKEVAKEMPQQKEEKKKRRKKKKKLEKVPDESPPNEMQEIGGPEETTLLESFDEEIVARATKKLTSKVLRNGSTGPVSKERKKLSDSSESESELDDYKEKQENDIKMKDAESAKSQQSDVVSIRKGVGNSTRTQVSGSKILFVGNLSYTAEQNDLREFFKDVGEVVDVRLAACESGRRKGRPKGFGHVEFTSEEEARKALELNGEELLGRPLKLDLACERVECTPKSGKDNNSYQTGGNGQSQTMLVYGLDKTLNEDQIRTSLQEHFGSCGEMTRVLIPKDYETGAPRGIAYIDFKDGLSKALQLNGSHLGGYALTVEEVGCNSVRSGGQDHRDGGARSGSRGHGGCDGGGGGGHGGGGVCKNQTKPSKKRIPGRDRPRQDNHV